MAGIKTIDLALEATEVIQLRIDFQVSLVFSDLSSVSFGCPFILTRADGTEISIDPEGDKAALVEVLQLHTCAVTRGQVLGEMLFIEFDHGTTIRCFPDAQYEAWEYFGKDKNPERIISTPGGELSIWNAKPA